MKSNKVVLLTKLKRVLAVLITSFVVLGLILQVSGNQIFGEETNSEEAATSEEVVPTETTAYLNDYLIRYRGIRFGGTENVTGAPITIQSGASVAASVAFTLNTETGSTTSSGVVEKGRIAFRFKVPSDVQIASGTGIIAYQEGSVDSPTGAYDGGAFRYYWGILTEDFEVGSATTAALTLTPFKNGVTNDQTTIEMQVDAFDYYQGILRPVGYVEGSANHTLTNTIEANTDKFAWNPVSLSTTPTAINTSPSQRVLSDTKFTLTTTSQTKALSAGVGFAKQIHFESTFNLPVDSNGNAYIDLDVSNFYGPDGVTPLNPADVTIDPAAKTFTVRQTIVNPDPTKEFTPTSWSFVLKGASVDVAGTDLVTLNSNETKSFNITAAGGSHQIDAVVNLDASIVEPYIIGQSAMKDVVIKYQVPKDQTGSESYLAPEKNITSINSQVINNTNQSGKPYVVMPGDKIVYQLGVEHMVNIQDINDVNGGKIERISYTEIAGTHYDPTQMTIQSISFGQVQNFTAGTITIKVTYSDNSVDTLVKDPTTPQLQLFDIPVEKRTEVTKFEIIYEGVNSGFRINTGSQISYVIRDQKDIRKNGMIISNRVTSNYKNDVNQINDITADSNQVDVIYNTIDMKNGLYEHNKTGVNLGGATGQTFPVENDVVLFTIKLVNDGNSVMVIDEVADFYTAEFLVPYSGTTTQVGGETAIDPRYINGDNFINLHYWENDPQQAGSTPIINTDMSVTQSGADMLDIRFATPIAVPVGETYYLTYTMAVNGNIHPLATIGNSFQSFYNNIGVGEGAFYWGPPTVPTTPTSTKSFVNVSGPDKLINNIRPYGNDVLVFKATIYNISGSDWGPNMKFVDTYSSNLLPHSTDQGFNTTGTYGSRLRLNTVMNLGISNVATETTASVVDQSIEAVLTGDGTFEIDLKDTEIKDGEKLTLYYTMRVKDDVKKNEVFTNSFVVYDMADSQLTRASVEGIVNEQQDYKGLVSLTKGAADTASNAPNYPFNRLRNGDEIEFTIAVSNLKVHENDSITFQTITDQLPSNMKYVEGSLQIEYQTLTRKMVNTNENDITNNTIVSKTSLPLPNEVQPQNMNISVDANNLMRIAFDNPVLLSDRYYESSYEYLIEYQYLITYKAKVSTAGIPQSTRLLNQINEVKVFFDNTTADLKQINGTVVADSTDLDQNANSAAYSKNSGQVTILNDNFVYGGITKNAVVDKYKLATGTNIANANVNVDLNTKRIYNISLTNYGAQTLDIDKVIDVLPEYETIVPGSMILVKNLSSQTITDSETLAFTTGTMNRDGKAYQTVRVDDDIVIPSSIGGETTYQIRYETQIDVEAVKAKLTETQTNTISGLKNQAAFYLKDTNGTMLLESGRGTVQGDDGVTPNEDWDNDVDTTLRYQADYAILDSANYITPLVDVKAETVTRAMGSTIENYVPYTGSTTIEPGELVAWSVRIGNGNQTNTQLLQKGSKVYIVLPDGLIYQGFGLNTSGSESIPTYLDASSFTSTSDAYGNTILSWTVNKDYVKNSSDTFRLRTKTKAFNFTTYAVKAYFVPVQSEEQEFYDTQLETSTEFRTLIYDHANEFEELSKLDSSYQTKTHYVHDNTAVEVYGDLGVTAMLTQKDTVNGTVITTRDDNRLMDVSNKEDIVRYTMRLESVSGTATMKDIVFVDRLPSVGDTRNLGLKGRGSEAHARLVGNGNFVVRYKANSSSTPVVLDSSQYKVEYFFGEVDEQFLGDDYKNVALPGRWLSEADLLTRDVQTLRDATAVRVIISDPSVVIGGLGNIEVDFDANLHEYYIGGKQAINTFGYHTIVGADTELIAEVLPVAYKAEIIKDRVLVEKFLKEDSDTPEDMSFTIELVGKNATSGAVEYQETKTVTVDERVTGGWNGQLWFYELPQGLNYTVNEVQNPNFKTPVYAPPVRTEYSDTTVQWTFGITNERNPLQLKVEKLWKGSNGENLNLNSPYLSDVEVELYPADQNGAIQGALIEKVTLTKTNDYKASFKDLNRYDSSGNELFYTIKEIEKTGYLSSFTFDKTTSLFTVENKLIPGSVVMKKTSNQSNVSLAGAVFDLYNEQGKVVSTHTTDNQGQFQVDGLTPGKYYFVEKQALENHILDSEAVPFEIAFNQQEVVEVTKLNLFDKNAQTGISTNSMLWMLLIATSGVTLIFITKRKMKKR